MDRRDVPGAAAVEPRPFTFVQDAAAAGLTGSAVEEMRAEYARRRQRVIHGLQGVPHVTVLQPKADFSAMVDIRDMGMAADDVRRRLLHDCGVVVIHGSAYGPGGEGTLRVCQPAAITWNFVWRCCGGAGADRSDMSLVSLAAGVPVPQADAAGGGFRKAWNANLGVGRSAFQANPGRCTPLMPVSTRSSRLACPCAPESRERASSARCAYAPASACGLTSALRGTSAPATNLTLPKLLDPAA